MFCRWCLFHETDVLETITIGLNLRMGSFDLRLFVINAAEGYSIQVIVYSSRIKWHDAAVFHEHFIKDNSMFGLDAPSRTIACVWSDTASLWIFSSNFTSFAYNFAAPSLGRFYVPLACVEDSFLRQQVLLLNLLRFLWLREPVSDCLKHGPLLILWCWRCVEFGRFIKSLRPPFVIVVTFYLSSSLSSCWFWLTRWANGSFWRTTFIFLVLRRWSRLL